MRLNQRTQTLCEADRIVHPRDSQPRVLRFDRADLLRINESRVRRRLRSCRQQRTLAFVLGRKGRKDRCDGSARLGINRRLRTSHPATTSCPNRPVTLNSSVLIRVIRGFKMRFIGVQTNSMPVREASYLQQRTFAIRAATKKTSTQTRGRPATSEDRFVPPHFPGNHGMSVALFWFYISFQCQSCKG